MKLRLVSPVFGRGGFSYAGMQHAPLRMGEVVEVPDAQGMQVLRWHPGLFEVVEGPADKGALATAEQAFAALSADERVALLGAGFDTLDVPRRVALMGGQWLLQTVTDLPADLKIAALERLLDDPAVADHIQASGDSLPPEDPEAGSPVASPQASDGGSDLDDYLQDFPQALAAIKAAGVTDAADLYERGRDWMIREVKGIGPRKAAKILAALQG